MDSKEQSMETITLDHVYIVNGKEQKIKTKIQKPKKENEEKKKQEPKIDECMKNIFYGTEMMKDSLTRIKIISDIMNQNKLLTENDFDYLNECLNHEINDFILNFCKDLSIRFDMNYHCKISKYSTSIDDAIYELITKKIK